MENNKYLREEIIRMSGVNTSKCMKCGKCSATCPAYDEMEYHPHQFVGMVETGDIKTSVPAIAITDAADAAIPSILTVTLPL